MMTEIKVESGVYQDLYEAITSTKGKGIQSIIDDGLSAITKEQGAKLLALCLQHQRLDACDLLLTRLPNHYFIGSSTVLDKAITMALDKSMDTPVVRMLFKKPFQAFIDELQQNPKSCILNLDNNNNQRVQAAKKLIKQIEGKRCYLNKNEKRLIERSELSHIYQYFDALAKKNHDIHKACEAFLQEFNYINDKGERVGFFVNFFGDNALTFEIRKKAVDMVNEIRSLNNDDIDAVELFFKLIEKAVSEVRNQRMSPKFSIQHKEFVGLEEKPVERFGNSYRSATYEILQTSRETKGNGFFETCIIKSLNAAKPYIEEIHHARIDSIIDSIDAYQPQNFDTGIVKERSPNLRY
jgi:hypothetical protein